MNLQHRKRDDSGFEVLIALVVGYSAARTGELTGLHDAMFQKIEILKVTFEHKRRGFMSLMLATYIGKCTDSVIM
jgi:hypothetical protein